VPDIRTRLGRRAATATVTIASLGLLAPGISFAVDADESPSTAQDPPQAPPETGFERSGGEEWTTLEEEYAFLEEVDERSDRVTVDEVATTNEDRPMHLVQFGSEPRTPEEAAEQPVLLNVCLQHGNEPAGRESCLQTLRDLALDSDPEIDAMLEDSTVLFIPTVNPDGRAANTRGNANGVDINRDHLALETPEGQAVAEVIRDYEADAINDVHEYGPARENYDYELLYLWSRNLNVDDRVYDYARELNEDYVVPAAEDEGYTTSVYGIVTSDPPEQIAGGKDERIFRNMAGLRHAAGMLTETVTSALPGETPVESRNRRVDTHTTAQAAALEFFQDNRHDVASTTDSAAMRATRQGEIGAGPIYIDGADNEPAGPEDTLSRNACSYSLTAEQYDEVEQTLDLHGIEVTEGDDGVSVSMAQPARAVIALLLDERAEYNIVDGEPVSCQAS